MNKIKVGITVFFGAIFSWLGILAIPVFLLLGCNIIDYITGLASAKYRYPDEARPIKSYKSIHGIVKKVCMYLLIIIGWMLDLMINQGLIQMGVDFTLPNIIATIIACWLIFNEMLSILENMDDIGVAIPPFLKPLLKMMKKQSEKQINVSDEEQE